MGNGILTTNLIAKKPLKNLGYKNKKPSTVKKEISGKSKNAMRVSMGQRLKKVK